MKKLFLLLALSVAMLAQAQMQDTLRVLCIGNSFTFFSDSHLKLVEIAGSQGHYIDMTAAYVGGYTFNRHLRDDQSIRAFERTGYDCVFLQDQSQMHARFATDSKRWNLVLEDTKELTERIRMYSPKAHIWLECTWAYSAFNCGGYGTMENFDRLLQNGAKAIAKKCDVDVSPIGKAFAIARAERPDINLYFPDEKHQSDYGTYLKSCVNYLLIYGQPFTANASDCGMNPEWCSYLRKVAEKVVLKKKY